MDAPLKKSKTFEEARVLLRRCFKKPLYALVPYDIWKNFIFVQVEDLKTLGVVAQLSRGSKCVVEEIRKNNMALAKRYRREGQIPMALKCLRSSAECNNPEALFELGWAYCNGGWGVPKNYEKGLGLYVDAAELGNGKAVIEYGWEAIALELDVSYAEEWFKKGFNSGDLYARAWCYFNAAAGVKRNYQKSISYYFAAALEQEIALAQFTLGEIYQDFDSQNDDDFYLDEELDAAIAQQPNLHTAFSWHMMAAKQGFYVSQKKISAYYRTGYQCTKSEELALLWSKKAQYQEHEDD